MSVHDTQNPESREDALTAATDAVRDGKLIVLPTDTVYGIGADAFTAEAVQALLDAKGRGRDTPPPVLVGDHAVLLALAVEVPDYAEQLAEEFWPGPLTLILKAQPSLTWDLGETRGTVALRMPDDEVALELLRRTGPLAVSSANRHGRSAALTVLDAATQLGDAVEEYLDGGTARLGTSSTIIDTTVEPAQIVREGDITQDRIVEVVGDIFTAPEPEPDEEEPEGSGAAEAEATADAAGDPADDSSEDSTAGDDASASSGEDRGAAAPGAASVLDLPSEPDIEDLSAESADRDAEASETPLTEAGDGPAPAADEPTSPAADPAGPETDPAPAAPTTGDDASAEPTGGEARPEHPAG